jgi:RNA polymerase sigma-70 factor (ECF subfamily)
MAIATLKPQLIVHAAVILLLRSHRNHRRFLLTPSAHFLGYKLIAANENNRETPMNDLQTRKLEFAECLRQHQSQLFGYINSLLRNLSDADDLFQQTSLILWKKFPEYDRSRSFLSWACGIARFEIANFLRARNRQHLYFTDELNLLLIETHEALKQDEIDRRREALSRCTAKLRANDRTLLEDCYRESSSVATVAEQKGRSPQSVHNSLRRIRRALFECIRRTMAQEFKSEQIA